MKRIWQASVICLFAALGLYLAWNWLQLLFTNPFTAVGIVAAFGILYLLVYLQERSERRRALKHMRDRPSLSAREFGDRYFETDQAEIAAQIRDIFAKHISVDISQVYPDDKLVEELRMDSLDSMATVEFLIELEKHFKITIPDSSAEQMRTLRDITDFVSRERQSNETSNSHKISGDAGA